MKNIISLSHHVFHSFSFDPSQELVIWYRTRYYPYSNKMKSMDFFSRKNKIQHWIFRKVSGWLIEWCFTPLSTIFQSHHGNNSHCSSPSWLPPVLFYTTFNNISLISWQQLTLFKSFLSSTSTVLHHFQQYFTHIMATTHIVQVLPKFHQYCFTPLSTIFRSYHGNNSHCSSPS